MRTLIQVAVADVRTGRIPSVLLAAAATMALLTASAEAAQRYAAQTGVTSNPCTAALPCDLPTAVNSATGADEIIVNPGTYAVGTTILTVPGGASMHGVVGQATPLIVSDANTAVLAGGAGTRLADLRITQSSLGSQALSIAGSGTLGERLVVSASTQRSCQIGMAAVLRDSICLNDRPAGGGLALTAATDSNVIATARNVTAVATGPSGFGAFVNSGGLNVTLNLRNVIASGTGADVGAFAAVTNATLSLSFSNWTTSSALGGGSGISITPAGSATNQANMPPLFVNAAGGDYRQAAGSPTIDAGAADGSTGATDFEGQARTQGTSMDIGGDEFAPAVTPPPADPPALAPPPAAADTTPPQTSIDKGPKKSAKSRDATFTFAADEADASFECRLDKESFEECTSPQDYKRLKKGEHTFKVRAEDEAGNIDASPATYDWKVKKPRKPKEGGD